VCLCLGFTGLPAYTRVASIDRFVAAEMGRQHVPGLAIGIYSRGQILLAKGYGLANVELNVAVKPETVFQSGSVRKQFVSAAIMMLVEEGKIGLDDSIVKYFPSAPKSWEAIQVKNLVSHTSGLAEYENEEQHWTKGAVRGGIRAEAEQLHRPPSPDLSPNRTSAAGIQSARQVWQPQ
jgi:CubicO group peptidase (beta-lactamase class C family)